MIDHVEARSLSSLNLLASNPPQYPSKPGEKPQEALTLYISRVPGTRDIILSTYKPHVKNVTAEDVANSFYYVHFNTPEDQFLKPTSQSASRESLDSRRSGHQRQNQIQRKPVPGFNGRPDQSSSHRRSLPRTRDAFPSPSASSSAHGGRLQQTAPQLHNVHTPDSGSPTSPRQSQHCIQRKPLQSRTETSEYPPLPARRKQDPVQGRPPMPKADPLPPVYGQERASSPLPGSSPGPDMEPVPPLPLRPDQIDDIPSDDEDTGSPDGDLPASRSPSPSKSRQANPFSLTIIRRDPSSGQQWNVGRVDSVQLEFPYLPAEQRTVASAAINVHLETSGYAKFRGMPVPAGGLDLCKVEPSVDVLPPQQPPERQQARPRLNTVTAPDYNVFERQVVMAYAPTLTENIRKLFGRRERSATIAGPTDVPGPGHGHKRSGSATIGAPPGGNGGDVARISTTPGPHLRPKGYMFKSPWEGVCEFRTCNGGRSLQCRHILPTYGAGWNPLVGGSEDADKEPKRPPGRYVSELRFNLPSNELFSQGHSPNSSGPSGTGRPREAYMRTREKIFHGMINKTESEDEAEAEGFDMSLGREKAGGGNRGRRAKMGKLIIWDEGLKMLDLVIAANVGVWWSVWERKSEW